MEGLSSALATVVLALGGLQGPQDPLETGELWQRAARAKEGPSRAAAVERALAASSDQPLERENLMLAWRTGVAEARALRLETALAIQEELHRRYAEPWSAIDLALSNRLAGRWEAADACLAGAIEREAARGLPTHELWNRRGITTLGRGDERRARDYLGMALMLGSDDAGVVLARLELDAGRQSSARAGFRALIRGDEPGAWALRGWGLSLLSPARR